MPILYFFLAVLVIVPSTLDAQSRDRGGREVSRSSLDDEIVEEFKVPLLFGLLPVTANYGDPRGGGTREHEGQDFFAPKGSPVVSPTEAVVIRTGSGSSAGNYVYTANPGGETFRYMHLDEIADIERGDKLQVGDLIGTNGDTGNATGIAYHLHFEVRDEDNDDTDPFSRLDGEFSLREKISFLDQIIDGYDGDEDEYAEFLVNEFSDEIMAGVRAGYKIPTEIKRALEDSGDYNEIENEKSLAETLAVIPNAVAVELKAGDQSLFVSLLQIYLIYTLEGPARDELAAAGPTGYFGPITSAAVEELQSKLSLLETGVYNSKTRTEAMEREPVLVLR